MRGFAPIAWIGLAGLASFALFNITFEVEALEAELNALNKQILEEQKAVHVLKAEWSYLSRPERIEGLSRRLLPHLQPPTAAQVGDFDSLAARTAPADEAEDGAAAHIRPAAARGAR